MLLLLLILLLLLLLLHYCYKDTTITLQYCNITSLLLQHYHYYHYYHYCTLHTCTPEPHQGGT